ncbi:cysteine hydrolase [Brachybacterium muris]|uniref:cysteine hydrolase family protein n=1 Tax=Brachybacterium muris TaxID=219301 RepID=UPI00223BD423|nr:isochorismatase family cysteine hydrolase [Brachybacterium muris]MCT2176769.1 cysteine hydrolase [Brachybacterium muris]MCT2261719.1 cysteine hydrolase [Brachybacterium muris]
MASTRTELRDALLLVDLQEAFFEAPELKRHRAEIVESANALYRAAQRAQVPVFVITTVHSRDRSTWTLSMLDDDQGYLFSGDPGTELVHEPETEGTTRLEKTRDSAWFGTDLLLRIHNLGVDRVVIAGVSTHACIAQTTRDAYANNIRAAIVPDAIGDERPDHRETVLDQLVEDRQAELVPLEEVIGTWKE